MCVRCVCMPQGFINPLAYIVRRVCIRKHGCIGYELLPSPPLSLSLSLPLFLSFSLLGIQAYKARGARSVYLQSIVGTLPPAIARFFLPLFFLITPIAVCVSFRPPPPSLSLFRSSHPARLHIPFPRSINLLSMILFRERRIELRRSTQIRTTVRRHPVLWRYNHYDTSARLDFVVEWREIRGCLSFKLLL